MKTRNIIAVLCVVSVLAGCAQSGSIGTVPANHVTQSNAQSVAKGTTFMNGAILANGITLANGASRALALKALASRPLTKKD